MTRTSVNSFLSQDDQDDLEEELDKMMEEFDRSESSQQTPSKAAPTALEQDILGSFQRAAFLQTLFSSKH